MTAMPSAFRPAMTSKQLVGFGERQAGGRLVKDDQPRLHRQRLGDLDHLPLRQRQCRQRRIGAEIGADARQKRRDHLALPLGIDEVQGPAAPRLAADKDIGGHVEIVEQVEFLMHEGDARRRCSRPRSAPHGPTPSTVIVPLSGAMMPPRIFISVDLPAPFSPTRPMTSPGRTSMEKPSSATTPG